MKLNAYEESIVHDYIMGVVDAISEDHNDILEKAELGIQFSRRVDFEIDTESLGITEPPLPAFSMRPRGTALLIFSQNAEMAREVLSAFKNGVLKTLTLRVERSWRCYIRCDNRVIEKVCEEDKESTEACCSALRAEC